MFGSWTSLDIKIQENKSTPRWSPDGNNAIGGGLAIFFPVIDIIALDNNTCLLVFLYGTLLYHVLEEYVLKEHEERTKEPTGLFNDELKLK